MNMFDKEFQTYYLFIKVCPQSTLNLIYYIMTTLLRALLLLTVICTMNSCSSDESEVADVSAKKVVSYSYNTLEITDNGLDQ
jgi:hypothetical protein